MNRKIPKWCQMIVTGVPVTKEQASEIIRRTDWFFLGYEGNNHSFNKKVKEITHMPDFEDDTSYNIEEWDIYRKDKMFFDKKWGVITCSFVINDWISSSYINGPHGWCHPDGKIGYSYDIGKHPSIEEVYNDWRIIAREFPYLNLGITLMNGNSYDDNIKPVISIKVKDGRAILISPEQEDVHKYHEVVKNVEITDEFIFNRLTNDDIENAIPLDVIEGWAKQVYKN